MTPPVAFAEKFEQVDELVELFNGIRGHLTDRERDRFDLDLIYANRDEKMSDFLTAWLLTILMRENPECQKQREGFIEILNAQAE